MRTCRVCNVEQPIDAFYRHGNGHAYRCKACMSAYSRARYAANPGPTKRRRIAKHVANRDASLSEMRARHLKRRYGLTVQTLQAMVLAQGNACALCGEPFSENRRPCVDHDHITGEVRGLLHKGCNVALGHHEKFADQCAAYLRRHSRLRAV